MHHRAARVSRAAPGNQSQGSAAASQAARTVHVAIHGPLVVRPVLAAVGLARPHLVALARLAALPALQNKIIVR